ncbi:MAG: GDP-L-fucose synthase [Actinomycetota bacterium]
MTSPSPRLLVTGGSGFLGRHLVAEFANAGYSDVFSPRSQEYDLRRIEDITRVLADSRPEIIVHLAAVVGGIGANQAHPGSFFYDNAVMGIQLMEQARLAGVEKLVVVGTVCSYPKFAPAPFREESLWDGYPEETNAPYGLAKKMLLVQAQAYREEFGFNAIYLLPANLYGPADNFDPVTSHVVPALIRKFSEAIHRDEERVVCWGTGTPTREFLFVTDAARGIRLATERYDGADPVNLGSGREVSIKDIAEMIAQVIGFGGEITWDASRPDGQPRRHLDTSRAETAFGFRADVPLEVGLRKTIDWYERYVADADPRSQPVLPS